MTGAKKPPIIAFVGIFDKHNEPVIMRNYLLDFVKREERTKIERFVNGGIADEIEI